MTEVELTIQGQSPQFLLMILYSVAGQLSEAALHINVSICCLTLRTAKLSEDTRGAEARDFVVSCASVLNMHAISLISESYPLPVISQIWLCPMTLPLSLTHFTVLPLNHWFAEL